MKRLTKISFLTYWISALLFSVLFVEFFLSGFVADKLLNIPSPVFDSVGTVFAIIVYYTILTGIMAVLAQLLKLRWWIMLVIFFVYGVLAEYFFFGNITSIIDFTFFGLLYVFMLGVPLAFTKLIRKIFE